MDLLTNSFQGDMLATSTQESSPPVSPLPLVLSRHTSHLCNVLLMCQLRLMVTDAAVGGKQEEVTPPPPSSWIEDRRGYELH